MGTELCMGLKQLKESPAQVKDNEQASTPKQREALGSVDSKDKKMDQESALIVKQKNDNSKCYDHS